MVKESRKGTTKSKRKAFSGGSRRLMTQVTAKKTPASPNRRHCSRQKAVRLSDQATFVSALQDVFKEDPTLKGESAHTKALKLSGLKKNGRRNSGLWLSKMGFENINKDLTAESVGKADIRELMHNTSGQGRKSVWDTAAEKRFVKYLTTAPKHNSGVAQWPSCAA